MGPYPQLCGGNGCCGPLCHVICRGAGPSGCELCPTEGPVSGEGTSLGWLPCILGGGGGGGAGCLLPPPPRPALSLRPSLSGKGESLRHLPQPKALPAQGCELPNWDEGACLDPQPPPLFLQQSPGDMARSSSCLEPPNAPSSRSP